MRINQNDVSDLLKDLRNLTGEQYFLRTSNGYYYISKRLDGCYRDTFDGSCRECWAWVIGALTLVRDNLSSIQIQVRQEVQSNG